MIKMKALRSGNIGDGASKVRCGREFTVSMESRAKELEGEGLAFRVDVPPSAAGKIKPPVNEAAVAGPLAEAGGETGAAAPAPSSPPVTARRPRRSKASETGLL